MEVENNKFVARQAILDTEMKTFAYELLYRNSMSNFYTGLSPEQSTSQIIFQNHIMGNMGELSMNKRIFINFDEKSLLAKLPLFLDKKIVVIELLEDMNVTQSIVNEVSELFKKGYKIALDDYDFTKKWEVLFPYTSFIKVDREDISIEKIATLTSSLVVKENNIRIIVERVETKEQFNLLSEIGVDYFQGYFFHKPELKSGYCIEPIKLNLLQLFSEVCLPLIEFDRVSEIISQDVGLINGILKLVNFESATNRVEITSVKQAVTFLGEHKIKQYVAIIAMTKLSSDCTNELLTESLVRAKMMEHLSMHKSFVSIQTAAFITGLLSNISAILKCPLSNILDNLPIERSIKEALLEKTGLLHEALEITKFFESPENRVHSQKLIAKHKISENDLVEDYHTSLRWCMGISQ